MYAYIAFCTRTQMCLSKKCVASFLYHTYLTQSATAVKESKADAIYFLVVRPSGR